MSREYVVDLLYNGFCYFEMITKRKLDDTICGICGVVGETYFRDGKEKNSCSRKEVCACLFLIIKVSSQIRTEHLELHF